MRRASERENAEGERGSEYGWREEYNIRGRRRLGDAARERERNDADKDVRA